MKRMGIILAASCFLATFGFGAEKTVSVLFSGGMTRVAPQDFNSFLQDYASYYFGQSDTVRTLRRSTEFEITLLVRTVPRLFLTFGSGLISTGLESDLPRQTLSHLEVKLSRTDKIRSIPVRVGLLYSWPLSRRLSLSPHVSLDAYISSFKETAREETKDLKFNVVADYYEWDVRTNAFSWGSTWGLSLGFDLAGWVSLFLDGGYRRARLGGFRGTQTLSDNGVVGNETNFRLLYYEFYADWMETGFRYLNLPMVYGLAPPDLVRDAVLDLSGPYLKAGLRVSF